MVAHDNLSAQIILLVEDDDGDAFLSTQALQEGLPHASVKRVTNGAEALAYLEGAGKYASAPKPACILLDLKMPFHDGHWFLQTLNEMGKYQHIPVIVLSGFPSQGDPSPNDYHNVACTIEKPSSIDLYRELLSIVTIMVGGTLGPCPHANENYA